MTEMGFKIDPSTAGSSVRFDPHNPKDHVRIHISSSPTSENYSDLSVHIQPITFHKRMCPSITVRTSHSPWPLAHPDPTLYPVMLKKFGKRLKRNYGWSEEDFYRRVS